tara:strand:- start:231 stop:536 length:306 start_codon:yes stop_codon:yes gene_type:complete
LIVTACVPEVEVDEVQEAEHEEALVEDQVRVEEFPSKTDIGSAEIFTVGVEAEGGVGVESALPPPPPPPPHEVKKSKLTTMNEKPFICPNSIHILKHVQNI